MRGLHILLQMYKQSHDNYNITNRLKIHTSGVKISGRYGFSGRGDELSYLWSHIFREGW